MKKIKYKKYKILNIKKLKNKKVTNIQSYKYRCQNNILPAIDKAK